MNSNTPALVVMLRNIQCYLSPRKSTLVARPSLRRWEWSGDETRPPPPLPPPMHFTEMAEGVVCYEPAPRYAHVAAAVDGKLYVWGGVRRDSPALDDLEKTTITSVVDVLDPKVRIL